MHKSALGIKLKGERWRGQIEKVFSSLLRLAHMPRKYFSPCFIHPLRGLLGLSSSILTRSTYGELAKREGKRRYKLHQRRNHLRSPSFLFSRLFNLSSGRQKQKISVYKAQVSIGKGERRRKVDGKVFRFSLGSKNLPLLLFLKDILSAYGNVSGDPPQSSL